MYEGKTSTNKWFPVLLISDTDFKTAVTGKVAGDLTVKYEVAGATSQTSYSVTGTEWKESGNGEYWLLIGASEFTSEEKFQVSVACASCLTHRFVVEVRDKTIAEVIDAIDAIKSVTDTLTNTGSEVTGMTGDIADIGNDILMVKLEVEGLTGDITDIKTVTDTLTTTGAEVAALSGMTSDIAIIRSEVEGLTGDITDIKTVTDAVPTALAGITGDIVDIKTVTDTLVTTGSEVTGMTSDIVNIKAQTDLLPSGLIDGVKTQAEVLEIILAHANGKIAKSGNSFAYKKQDNTTTLFTLNSSSTDRTRS